ncbi:SAM-dependent methyltransferase [Pimelobacter simplex]|uniref:SAM-dependent methyltransferase n=1 Tax=Nocardioides simplex TaxID=2045 RepID=UPI0036721EF9
MGHAFDQQYWDDIWSGERAGAMGSSDPNPHLRREVAALRPGSALDAGCGAGAEAIWLASAGWTVTAADIAAEALALGELRAEAAGLAGKVHWVRADLAAWEPDLRYDLVTTHYAHPAMPQLEFYRRISSWVAPGGTLLVVGHAHGHHHEDDQPPAEASATAAAITALLDPDVWKVETAVELDRTTRGPRGRTASLHDVIVRAARKEEL